MALDLNGMSFAYSEAFDLVDPDGEQQVSAEEAIAAQLFDCYEDYSLFEHACMLVRLVAFVFCTAGGEGPFLVEIGVLLDLLGEVQDYLAGWQNSLADKAGPHDEEANQAGRSLLLVVLRQLLPGYVQQVQLTPVAATVLEHGLSMRVREVTEARLAAFPTQVADFVRDRSAGAGPGAFCHLSGDVPIEGLCLLRGLLDDSRIFWTGLLSLRRRESYIFFRRESIAPGREGHAGTVWVLCDREDDVSLGVGHGKSSRVVQLNALVAGERQMVFVCELHIRDEDSAAPSKSPPAG